MIHILQHVKFMAGTRFLGCNFDASLRACGPVVAFVDPGIFSIVNQLAHAIDIMEIFLADLAQIGSVDH